ncbi:hypothetical protein TNCV_3083301 [Trichonephila clavipes]|nr:hypothetical protein TNCV_3083301 [Trichonephila clavipes]
MQDFMIILQYESHSLIASIEKPSFAKERISKPESYFGTMSFSVNLYRSDGQYKVWRQVGKDPKNTIKTLFGDVCLQEDLCSLMDKMVCLEILKNHLQKVPLMWIKFHLSTGPETYGEDCRIVLIVPLQERTTYSTPISMSSKMYGLSWRNPFMSTA